ncbi:MAG: response regulator [Planctomycetota bacterium]|nr:response regulator [Planctomycetota bacterium]
MLTCGKSRGVVAGDGSAVRVVPAPPVAGRPRGEVLSVSRETGPDGWLLTAIQDPLLEAILEEDAGRRGYNLRPVRYPAQALEALKTGRVAAAIGDMDAPHLPGIDILQIVSSVSGDIPVVLVGGQGSAKIAVEAMREGAFAFLAKPFEPDYLVATVRRAIEMYELRRELLKLKQRDDAAAHAASSGGQPAPAGGAGSPPRMGGSPCARIGPIERLLEGGSKEGDARRTSLRRALEAHGWNFGRAAKALGMPRAALYEEARRLNVRREDGSCRGGSA